MPYNGSGVFALPAADFPAVASTLIESTKYNNVGTDISTGLTTAVTKDGQTATTAVVPFAFGVKTDTVVENTSATGVTLDGVKLKDSGVDISAAGTLQGQIVFPATQNASSGANTLDDYEESTWTPTLTNWTNTGSPTIAGKYTKVGRLVFWTLLVTPATNISATAGTSTFNLPFTPGNSSTLVAANDTTGVGIGTGLTDSTAAYPPTTGVMTERLVMSGTFMV